MPDARPAVVPPIPIEARHWAILDAILRRHVPDREVWAFGSRARGTTKRYADLDLAILGEAPLSVAEHAALTDALSESDLPWRVDILDWCAVSPEFQQRIARDRVVLRRP